MHLTTIGRKSGKERDVIVAYLEDRSNVTALAMKGWDEGHPWWLDLEPTPTPSSASPTSNPAPCTRAGTGDERECLWQRWLAIEPEDDFFARRRSVETPIVVFEPTDNAA